MTRIIVWAGKSFWIKWLGFIAVVIQAGVWAFDRTPPYEVLSPVLVFNGPPGGSVKFQAKVRRDLDRDCSVEFMRYIIDGAGARHDLPNDPRHLSAEGIRKMAEQMGLDRLILSVAIPIDATPGPSVYGTELEYTCNPIHVFKPITVTSLFRFVILPKTAP